MVSIEPGLLAGEDQVTNIIPEDARIKKVYRMKRGETLRVLDLFAGCGGLSLGFQAAGFEIAGAVELDPVAAKSHALNFYKHSSYLQKLHAHARDITKIEPEQLVTELEIGTDVASSIDVIIGGPPCQAFARVGRAKLREVADHPEAFKQDARGNLYLRYLAYVRKFQPLALLMENVPDVLNYGGHNIAHEMCEVLTEMGYVCRYTLLNAAFYGVPQMRERMFLMAYAKELETEVEFPSPTHWVELPKGYEGSRQVALKSLGGGLFNGNLFSIGFYTPAPATSPKLPYAVTAQEALQDLPRITEHLEGKLKRGIRRLNQRIPYPENMPVSPYAVLMRNWPGFENHEGVTDHVIRSLPRDYDIFRRMNPGDQYPEAYQHALNLFKEKLAQLATQGVTLQPGTHEYEDLRKKIVPPYDATKFPNKWRKMEPDQPARTLMAHLGKDSYSHIHYDSTQARTISVREAARLQSFPDGFEFCGTMNPAFRQIGNAVPPLLALALATKMMNSIRGNERCHEN
ncbi:MAG TPA: DNA cytosine methyltransferase [Ktedonobacteraceae bacterium]|nr:DNA cytosine methyltransferase [Ktedonobacteraceae bacterium]